MRLLYSFALLLSAVFTYGEYPSDFPKCKNADEACLVNAANEIIQKYYTGRSDVNLSPFDPFKVKSLHLERVPNSPVNIDVQLSNVEIEGLKGMKVSTFNYLNSDLSGRNTFVGTIPEFIIKGHYIIDGQIIILPISGEGNLNLKCKNMRFKYTFDLKPVEKNGKTYAALTHVKLEMDPEHVTFRFDSLFNGDKTLTNTANEFVNGNWKEIYHEMKPSLSKTFSLIVKSVINRFYEKYPYEEYFL